MNRKILRQMISQVLEPHRFCSAKDMYYRRDGEVFLVLALDRPSFGGPFFIELGLFVDETGQLAHPPPVYLCHIRQQLTVIMPKKERISLIEALDLERAMPQADRSTIIRHSIESYALPFLEALNTVDKIVTLLNEGDPRVIPGTMILHDLLFKRMGWKPPTRPSR
ncbi:MAG TPA: DUF4304 domain-containing protein [Gemmatales bacterium]|nr:DUF4304 domain-containing protein [Gemmatales bacterium]